MRKGWAAGCRCAHISACPAGTHSHVAETDAFQRACCQHHIRYRNVPRMLPPTQHSLDVWRRHRQQHKVGVQRLRGDRAGGGGRGVACPFQSNPMIQLTDHCTALKRQRARGFGGRWGAPARLQDVGSGGDAVGRLDAGQVPWVLARPVDAVNQLRAGGQAGGGKHGGRVDLPGTPFRGALAARAWCGGAGMRCCSAQRPSAAAPRHNAR